MTKTVYAWLFAMLMAGTAAAGEPLPSLNAPDLAQGPYSAMHMLLEKTILNVDVLTVDIRVNKATQTQFTEIAGGKGYSDALGKQIADIAVKTDHAVVQLKFMRDVSLDQWMDAVRENLQQAKDAGLLTAKVQQRVASGLPKWFSAISKRGYEEGDRVIYQLRPSALRTVVVSKDGAVLVDQMDRDKDAPRVVMASYFAPKSDFRDLLLKSLFKSKS
jgi:hypothetical protein